MEADEDILCDAAALEAESDLLERSPVVSSRVGARRDAKKKLFTDE